MSVDEGLQIVPRRIRSAAPDATIDANESPEFQEFRASAGRRLIFVTNRGPIEHILNAEDNPIAQRGAGGVVSGLLCAAQERRVTWISLAMNDADRMVAERLLAGGGGALQAPAGLERLSSRLVPVPEATFHRYYDGFSNRVLWFVQHGMRRARAMALSSLRRHWERGYVAVNAAVADAVVAELRASGEATPVMFHDYHLYLAAGLVRERVPRARLLHFVHIPWPEPAAWEALPPDILRAIYGGLAGNDVLGFQTARDAHNFLKGAARYLPGAVVAYTPGELHCAGRCTLVQAYPIAVTPSVVFASANRPQAGAQVVMLRRQLQLERGRRLILRVDRVEPTKNIVQGFRAYERLLVAHPELRGQVVFLALLVPSREGLPEYRDEAERVRRVIERINTRFGTADWQPVVALFGNDHERALACMRHYDVLLVNPLIDGMNLVAKEGGLLNRRDGVLVLSERAGAYAQLYDGVLSVAPEDVQATAKALYRALTLPPAERARLARTARTVLLREDAGSWLGNQVADLSRVTGPLAGTTKAERKEGVEQGERGERGERGESVVREAERVAARRLADTQVSLPEQGLARAVAARPSAAAPAVRGTKAPTVPVTTPVADVDVGADVHADRGGDVDASADVAMLDDSADQLGTL